MLTNIQALRAFAALNVAMFHAIGAGVAYGMETRLLAPFEGWGANGVDLFFVISGFVMVVAQKSNPKVPMDFLRGRVTRIVPLYWAATALMILLLLVMPAQAQEVGLSLKRALTSLLFVSQPVMGVEPLVYLGWTLEYEFAFYLLFAIGIWHGGRGYGLVVAGLLAFAPFAGLIMLEFALGMLSAGIYRAHITRVHALALLSIGFVGLCVSILWHPSVDRLFLWGIPAFLIVLGAARAQQIPEGAATFLGKASYSIYLVQVFTIPVIYKLATRLVPAINGDILAMGAVVLTAGAGCVCYFLVEQPLGKLFVAKRRPSHDAAG